MSIDYLNYIKKVVLLPVLLLLYSGCAHTLPTHNDRMKEKGALDSIEHLKTRERAVQGEKRHNSDEVEHFNAGFSIVKNGDDRPNDFRKAAAEFSAAVSIKPDFEEARLNLGLAYMNLGDFEKALEQFKEIENRAEGIQKQKAIYNTGISYFRMGRLDDAAKSIEPLIADENYDAAILLGKIHSRQGRTEAAINDFEKSAGYSPGRTEAYLNMANLYMESKEKSDLPRAIHNFQKALKLQPDNADACFDLGVLYYRLGDTDKSVKMFTRVTMLSTDAGAAYYNLGLIRYRSGDIKNAVMYLTLAKSYDYSPAIVALTKIHLDENRIDTALNLINQFISTNKNYPEAYCSLGAVLQKSGRNEEAKTAYLAALKLSPKNIMALNNLAVLYRKIGEFDKALDTNYKILKIDPDFPYAHKNLGIIYDIFLNDYKVAKYHYGEYLRIGPDKGDNVRLWLEEMDKRGRS